ncbi:tryptophan 2,3-dioxygenase [Candidatus Palauibacter sp.]|uniref:tryptophan 2,3-dioxygenase n=1 Tax=Candidatus Palauibacter sp. TaxID=3101350 RepID=UPI003B5C02D4
MTHEKYQTYAAYLHLEELLSLQVEQSGTNGGDPEHDEMLFIIIHQVYELWFKQLLHELDFARDRMAADDLPRLLHTMTRILTILKVQVAQLDILETMRPLDFLAFRQRLEEASGLQSFQFRELEFALGFKRTNVFGRYAEGSEARRSLERRYHSPSLWAAFLRFLHGRGFEIPEDVLEREVTAPTEPSRAVQAALIELHREDPFLVQLCERLVDLDEGLQEWRYRHVKMVERTIGARPGTGRTAGAAYLRNSLNRPVFPDLWAIRTDL